MSEGWEDLRGPRQRAADDASERHVRGLKLGIVCGVCGCYNRRPASGEWACRQCGRHLGEVDPSEERYVKDFVR